MTCWRRLRDRAEAGVWHRAASNARSPRAGCAVARRGGRYDGSGAGSVRDAAARAGRPGLGGPRNDLPAPLSTFVGRAAELAALAEPCLLPAAVAAALGVQEQAGRPLVETLAARLAGRELLLVLDSCEHLLAACARLAERLLRGCPGLRVLATSRQPFGVAGEACWRVPPLTPPAGAGGSAAPLAESEAGRLFVERARAVAPPDGRARIRRATLRRVDRCKYHGPLVKRRAEILTFRAGQMDGHRPGSRRPARVRIAEETSCR